MIIDNGNASSYCNQTSPPPAEKATKAGAPKILLVEHWVAITETAKKKEFSFLFEIK